MFICSSWKMRIRMLVMSIMIVMQMWAIKSGAVTVPIDDVGGLPGPNISNSSSTGVSLSNGMLTLNSTGTNMVYALFPYIPFNTSDPSLGSFNTLFDFKILSSVGALGFITVDPDSNITKLEDLLLSIADIGHSNDWWTHIRADGNYLAVVYNFTRNVPATTARIGLPLVFLDAFRSDELLNCTGTWQYIKPASIPRHCPSINSTGTVCPMSRLDLRNSYPSASVGFGFPLRPLHFTAPVPRLVGFFAFDGGVFDVSFWRFTTLDLNNTIVVGTSETILIASLPNSIVNGSTPTIANASTPPFANPSTPPFANASMSSTPYPGSILTFMIVAFLLIFFNEL